jgi:hypothetical protein
MQLGVSCGSGCFDRLDRLDIGDHETPFKRLPQLVMRVEYRRYDSM